MSLSTRIAHTRLAVEELAAREVPAVLTSIVGGVLTLTGTGGDDSAQLLPLAGDPSQYVLRTFTTGDAYRDLRVLDAGSFSSVRFDAGAGDDTFFNGTAVPSTVSGGDGDDVITGGAGDDVILGQAGNDRIDGGDGGDQISGNAGNDVITGGAGMDDIRGQAGNDDLDGGAGDGDVLRGGDGKDTLRGGDGNDTLYGDAGNDTVYGDAGNDRLFGGDGDDDLEGGYGSDELYGQAGDDVLDAVYGYGADYLFGDEAFENNLGADVIHAAPLVNGVSSDYVYCDATDIVRYDAVV